MSGDTAGIGWTRSRVRSTKLLSVSGLYEEPLWGGRFGAPPAEAFERLNASIPFDIRLAPYDIRGSVAHARMLGVQGIVSDRESATLVRGPRRC